MSKNNYIVAVYPSHTVAEAAIKELQQSPQPDSKSDPEQITKQEE